jgi:hypothetical protein
MNKTIQREKENSFFIKKSASYVRKDLNLTGKYMSIEKEKFLVQRIERKNLEKEELYYVDELKKEFRKID